ncbi:class I SAM-dependent DNA methyltransferase [Chromohalobacter japonicus]|uniref:class I SAM-dependent DNA methyltransferase n=1 Tax=Chromohalobacter japonicus TaxID=223900 RepID=UPI003F909961
MPLSWNEIRSNALTFSREWAGESNENAEAKSFWDDFFKVFGVPRRRIASYEMHVEKAGGRAGFIDLFWPGVLIAEHKSRGRDLSRAFTQAIDYFPGIRDSDLPRYVVVSDFARFRIHDLETDEQSEFALEDLHEHVQTFGFIAGYETRTFREQDPVNIRAADKLARLHDQLRQIGYDGHDLEVYLVRILFCLFAEDTGIFMPRNAFYDFIDLRTSEDGSDVAARLGELFEILNTPEEKRLKTSDEQLNEFPYINGGLFRERLRTAAFDRALRQLLLDCCDLDWGQVSPAIFGSLFQGIMNADMRRNLGAHYTSAKNIMKAIGPLFLDDLRAELEKCGKNKAKLKAFHDRLASLNFFDPACGCGNFLVITYREIRLLELEVIRRLYGEEIKKALHLLDVIDTYIRVNVDQFHGIEIEEWPAQIAGVAMWLIDHQMNVMISQEFGNAFVRIPLVKSANIVCDNALRLDWTDVVHPSKCHYLMGNPPFRGKRYMSKEQREDLKIGMRNMKGANLLDFVSGWYFKATEYMLLNPAIETALVSTNSICQGEQASILWSVLYGKGAVINFAHRTFEWTSEAKGKAAVHCIIVGMALFPRQKKTIYDYPDIRAEPEKVDATRINPYLVDGPEFALPRSRKALPGAPKLSFGSMPNDNGNLIIETRADLDALLAVDPDAEPYIRLYQGSDELINGLERWCLWLKDVPPTGLRKMQTVMKRVAAVRATREVSSRPATNRLAETPAAFGEDRQPVGNYIAIPKTSSERRRYIPVAMLDDSVIANTELFTLPNSGNYELGILSSMMHNAWTRVVCGRLKSDYRYSSSIVYNNFPWPKPSITQRQRIEATAQAILDARAIHSDATLADLYDPLSMPAELRKAHEANDKAVDAAYGRRKFKGEAERVAFLFELYQEHREEAVAL